MLEAAQGDDRAAVRRCRAARRARARCGGRRAAPGHRVRRAARPVLVDGEPRRARAAAARPRRRTLDRLPVAALRGVPRRALGGPRRDDDRRLPARRTRGERRRARRPAAGQPGHDSSSGAPDARRRRGRGSRCRRGAAGRVAVRGVRAAQRRQPVSRARAVAFRGARGPVGRRCPGGSRRSAALEALARRTRARLERLSGHAPALASAMAVLGDGAPLRHAAALAGMPSGQEETMQGRLTRKGSITVLALTGTLAAVGVGYAAIPGVGGVIQAATTPARIRPASCASSTPRPAASARRTRRRWTSTSRG